MVHKSWGAPAPASVRDRTRTDRISTPIDETFTRLEARAAEREAQAREREAVRQARRQADVELTATDPHRAAAQRHRGSGRRDIVREQRDTTSYTMIVDADRIRTLARRGASPSSLASVFNLSVEEIADVLARQD